MPDLKLQAWFLDEGTFVGREEDLVRVMDLLVEEGPARGLVLSTTFTSPFSPGWPGPSPGTPGRRRRK